jgi:hypothetical protein
MNATKLLTSIAPWVLFTVIASRLGADLVGWAAAGAGALVVVVAIRGRAASTSNGRRNSLKLIDAAGIVTFAAMAVLAFTGSHTLRTHIVDYGRGTCALILALVMLGSLLVMPFTEQYARESVPEAYWHSPVFRAVNRRISAAFGLAILAMAGSHFVSGALESSGHLTTGANLVLNWVIPIGLIVAAMKYMQRVTGSDEPTGRSA